MKLILSDRIDVAEGTVGVWLTPEAPLDFAAGQFADFTLPGLKDADGKGDTRAFSIACAPGGERILVATRVRDSAFKRALATAPYGTVVEMAGPMGDFILHRDATRPAAFLVGGIGITPVRSIVEQAMRTGRQRRITVFHASRSLAATPFLGDFERWANVNPNLVYIPTLTRERPAAGGHETGRIDRAMLARHLQDLLAPVYYVVGPPAMVGATRAMLDEAGVDELQVRSEDFGGY